MMEPTTKRAARIQRLPRTLYVLLALVFLAGGGMLTFIHPTAAHADTTWNATLGANPAWNGLLCWGGDGGADAVVTLGGVSAWQTIPANNQVDYIYCKVTDTAFPHPHGVTVAVNYWDGPSNGHYVVQYASTSSAYSSSETVNMTGTNSWMTHTFTLYDANFAGGENNGADFRIATEGNAPVGVAVSQISVALSNVPAPPAIQQVQLGNIFSPGQTPTFNFTTTAGSVSYQVYNYDNNQVASGTAPATSGKGSITVTGLPYGNYTLVVASDNNGTLSPPVMTAFGVMPAAMTPNGASPFGAVVHIDQGQDSQFQGLLSNVGVSNFRGLGPLTNWAQIETSPGVYNWAQTDQDMAKLKAAGYSGSLGVGGSQPSFYQGDYKTNAATLQAWVHVNAAFFKRYANDLPYMMTQIANEPDINSWTPQQYFNVLKPFYTAVKAADPTLQVLGPTGPGIGSWSQQLIQLGGLHYLDAWDIHPYRAVPEGIDTTVTQLEQWLQQQNGGKAVPIVASEIGWDVSKDWNTPGTATSRWQQAAYYARVNTLLLKAGVKHIWWYEAADEWGTWGLLDGNCCWLSASAPGGYGYYTPHPAYNVAGTVSSQLADATYTATMSVVPTAKSQPVQAYQFTHANGTREDVLWTTGAPTSVQLPAPGPVTTVNAMGDSLVLQPHNGFVSLTLTGDPVYVTGASGSSVHTGSCFQISAPATAAAGDTVPVKLSLASCTPTPTQATFVVNGKSYTVSQGSPQTAMVLASSIQSSQTVRATVSVGNQNVGQVATTFQVGQAMAVKVDPQVVSTSPAQIQLNVTVRNNMASTALTLSSLQWHVGPATSTLTDSTSIAANSSHIFTISMPSSVQLNSVYSTLINLQYSVGTGQNQTQSFSQTVDFAPIFNNSLGTSWTTAQLQSQPSIALPDQTQWDGSTTAPTVSGKLWWNWDNTYLYMTAQINQADFTEPNAVDSSWQYDDVQFAVSPALPDGTATAGSAYSAFNVALTPSGPQIQRFESPLPTQILTDANLRIIRDNTTNLTTYYLALPWSDIAGVSPTTANFGLTWLTNVTVAGKQGRQGWFQWGSGFGVGRDPSQFNFAQLMP